MPRKNHTSPKKHWKVKIEAKKNKAKKSTTNILGISDLLMILRIYDYLRPVKSIIIEYVGPYHDKIIRDCSYHVGILKNKPLENNTSHGLNIKTIERKVMKRIFLYYIRCNFPELPRWVKKHETPTTAKAQEIEVLAWFIKKTRNKSGKIMGIGLASRIAYYYLNRLKEIYASNICRNAPYCNYMKYCSGCVKLYCDHSGYSFNTCYTCNELDVCSNDICDTLYKCSYCDVLYCSRDSDHRTSGCPEW